MLSFTENKTPVQFAFSVMCVTGQLCQLVASDPW